MHSFFLFAAVFASLDTCPFTKNACPVDLDNAIDVFYFDENDMSSCQHQCQKVHNCEYFTMIRDGPMRKCFLFKECSQFEMCADCITGPQTPDYIDCARHASNNPIAKQATNMANTHTCETSIDNVIGIYYFDAEEDDSCKQECDAIGQCSHWTQFEVSSPHLHNKCFLFASCDKQEPCGSHQDCDTQASA